MLTENDVVNYVGKYLKDIGYEIKQQLMTTQHGIDVIATKKDITILIEAKGATSATFGTSRYGKEFSRNQTNHHVAVALYTITKLMTKFEGNESYKYCIALPHNKLHIEAINAIYTTIEKLGIIVILVKDNGDVIVRNEFNY